MFFKTAIRSFYKNRIVGSQFDMMYSQLYIYTWYIWIFRTIFKNDKSLNIYFVK